MESFINVATKMHNSNIFTYFFLGPFSSFLIVTTLAFPSFFRGLFLISLAVVVISVFISSSDFSSILCGVGGDCGGVDRLWGDRDGNLGLLGSRVNNGIFNSLDI